MDVTKEKLRFVIFYETQLGTPPTQIHSRLVDVFGDGVISYSTVASWAARYRRGETTVADIPRAGRPAIPDLPSRVLALLDDTPFLTAHAMADMLGVGKQTVLALNFIWCSLRWVPHELTDTIRAKRVELATTLLSRLQSLGPRSSDRVITGDLGKHFE